MEQKIPAISGDTMASVDRIMMDEVGLDTLQLMELAGYGIADFVRRHISLDLAARPNVLALAGTGGNGGDALVAARLMHVWGANPTVVLSQPRSDLSAITAHQLNILDQLGIEVNESPVESLPPSDLIIDGLLGFSLRGDPRGESARLIAMANDHPTPVLAIDLPSGLDATTGHAGSPAIQATATVTLALPKTGLLKADPSITGDIWLADIGVPSGVYQRIGVTVPTDVFAHDGLVRLR